MSFLDHLDDLRKVVIRSLMGVLVAVIIGYIFSSQIQTLLIIPFETQGDYTLSLLHPTEGFITILKLSLVAGIFISAPWTFYQIWLFIAPGLYVHEKKMVWPVVFFTTLCFLLGGAFAYMILPWATSFFLSFGTDTVTNLWSLGKYIDFLLRLFLAFAIVFELPVAVYFLARIGLVTPAFLRTYRKHAYVVVIIGASIITPPDVFTQLIMALPMVMLYEISILLAVGAAKAHLKTASAAGLNEESEAESQKEGGTV